MPKAKEDRKIELRLHDAFIGIWQDDARDPTFERDIYGGVIRLLRDIGWTIGADPKTKKHYPILSRTNRLGKKGTMRCSINCTGRVVELEFWATTWPMSNRNGPRYDHNKRSRMLPMDRRRLDLISKRIIHWLARTTEITELQDKVRNSELLRFPDTTAQEYIAKRKKSRFPGQEPPCASSLTKSERTSQDGGEIKEGARVYTTDTKGRWLVGKAYFCGGNMWQIVTGTYSIEYNQLGNMLRLTPPSDLRRKDNERERRARLEKELRSAMEQMNFKRAETLKAVLFGDADLYRIKSDKGFYRTMASGYSQDLIGAGLYTLDEAKQQIGSHSQLKLLTIDGKKCDLHKVKELVDA